MLKFTLRYFVNIKIFHYRFFVDLIWYFINLFFIYLFLLIFTTLLQVILFQFRVRMRVPKRSQIWHIKAVRLSVNFSKNLFSARDQLISDRSTNATIEFKRGWKRFWVIGKKSAQTLKYEPKTISWIRVCNCVLPMLRQH